jgi:hypothetical protein
MDKSNYEKSIRSLVNNNGCRSFIMNPTIDDLVPLCPHLTEEQIHSVLQKDIYFACPSLLIKNAFIVLHHLTYEGEDYVKYAFSCKTRQSYADGELHGDVEHVYTFMDEAITYANKHWGNTLILDDWHSFMTIHVQDPIELDSHNYPKNIFNLYIGLKRDYNDFINENDKPRCDKFDDEIAIITTDYLLSDEIRGGRGGYTEFSCAHCGGGLSLKYCTSCGNKFKDDNFRSGWYTPLSDKMIKTLIDAGHTFVIDPKIAQEKSREEFNKSK